MYVGETTCDGKKKAYEILGEDVPMYIMDLPLWWILSTPGVFVIAVVGVVILLKKVFVNFDLDEEGGQHDN